MKIISSYFDEELDVSRSSKIVEYTCDKKQQKINMDVVDIPPETRTLILVVDDPKASSPSYTCCVGWNLLRPKNSPFTANTDTPLKKEAFEKEEEEIPETHFYEILCKPEEKIYRFKVLALDNEPKITTEMVKEGIDRLMEGHILDSAEIIAAYKK